VIAHETATTTIATVAGQAIPVAWLDERLAELRRGPLGRHLPPDGAGEAERLRRWVAQEVMRRMVLIHEAHRARLLDEPADDGDQLPSLQPDVARALFDRVTADINVDEPALRGYYERNPDLYHQPESRRVSYAIADSEAAARAVRDSGTWHLRPEALPMRYGEITQLRRGELTGPIEDAVFRAGPGEVVGPFRVEQGWIVARVESVLVESRTPFEKARGGIRADLLRALRERAFDDWLALRQAVLTVIEPGYEHPGHPELGLPHHRH
jgi:[acyl-carrier-protein] S-malonyltransferase